MYRLFFFFFFFLEKNENRVGFKIFTHQNATSALQLGISLRLIVAAVITCTAHAPSAWSDNGRRSASTACKWKVRPTGSNPQPTADQRVCSRRGAPRSRRLCKSDRLPVKLLILQPFHYGLSRVLTREYSLFLCIGSFFLKKWIGRLAIVSSKVFWTKPQCGQTEGLSAGQLAPGRPQRAVFVLAAHRERTWTPRAERVHKSPLQPLSCAAVCRLLLFRWFSQRVFWFFFCKPIKNLANWRSEVVVVEEEGDFKGALLSKCREKSVRKRSSRCRNTKLGFFSFNGRNDELMSSWPKLVSCDGSYYMRLWDNIVLLSKTNSAAVSLTTLSKVLGCTVEALNNLSTHTHTYTHTR